VQVTRSRNS